MPKDQSGPHSFFIWADIESVVEEAAMDALGHPVCKNLTIVHVLPKQEVSG